VTSALGSEIAAVRMARQLHGIATMVEARGDRDAGADREAARTSMPDDGRPRSRHVLRYLLVIAGLLVIVGLLGGIKFAQIHRLMGFGANMAASGPPPEAVGTDRAQASDWETTLAAVGTVSGAKSVAVSNDAPGLVARLRFESGAMVKRGQILVELDAKQDRAQLASAVARRANAERMAGRSRELLAKGAIPREQLDTEETQLEAGTADVAALQAQIERKIIRAPFDGRLGIRAVDLGQYLAPGTTVTTLDSVEGTFVDFTLPQEQIGAVAVGMQVRLTTSDAGAPLLGAITAIDPTVDSSTRSIKLRASLVDPRARVRPGMFVDVAVILPRHEKVVSVPATALVHAAYGDSVFVIEPKPPGSPGAAATPDGRPIRIARQQFVQLGAARGDFVAIAKGIAPGSEVVSAGAFKLRNGGTVVVDNRVKPVASLAPHPENH
jgi:membrane fusion protein (multidrug efflux system)